MVKKDSNGSQEDVAERQAAADEAAASADVSSAEGAAADATDANPIDVDDVDDADDAGAAGAVADAVAATGDDADRDEPISILPDETDMERLERQLSEAQADVAAAGDRALRTLAEFDNFRRRSFRERDGALEQGMAEVLRELLDVADNFDRALEHAGDDVPASFLEGMNLVKRGLHELLDRKSVVQIDAEGQPFNPEFHEALTSQPVEGVEPNTIVQVVQPGYSMNDRVLRPAKVIVAAPLPAPAETGSTDDAGGDE